jgi:hypothetical protein
MIQIQPYSEERNSASIFEEGRKVSEILQHRKHKFQSNTTIYYTIIIIIIIIV